MGTIQPEANLMLPVPAVRLIRDAAPPAVKFIASVTFSPADSVIDPFVHVIRMSFAAAPTAVNCAPPALVISNESAFASPEITLTAPAVDCRVRSAAPVTVKFDAVAL